MKSEITRLCTCVSLTLLNTLGYSQEKVFLITNDLAEPLPYTSIAVSKASAVSTDGLGMAVIKTQFVGDSIMVSRVGYTTKVLPKSVLFKSDTIKISLQKRDISLPEVIIGTRKNKLQLGCLQKKEGYSYIKNKNPTGAFEAVILLNKYPKHALLESFSVYISKIGNSNLPFEVKLYDNNLGQPGQIIMDTQLVIDQYPSGGWFTVPMQQLKLQVPDGGFFIGIKWLCASLTEQRILAIGETDVYEEDFSFFKYGYSGWRSFSTPFKSPNGNPTNIMMKVTLNTF